MEHTLCTAAEPGQHQPLPPTCRTQRHLGLCQGARAQVGVSYTSLPSMLQRCLVLQLCDPWRPGATAPGAARRVPGATGAPHKAALHRVHSSPPAAPHTVASLCKPNAQMDGAAKAVVQTLHMLLAARPLCQPTHQPAEGAQHHPLMLGCWGDDQAMQRRVAPLCRPAIRLHVRPRARRMARRPLLPAQHVIYRLHCRKQAWPTWAWPTPCDPKTAGCAPSPHPHCSPCSRGRDR